MSQYNYVVQFELVVDESGEVKPGNCDDSDEVWRNMAIDQVPVPGQQVQ